MNSFGTMARTFVGIVCALALVLWQGYVHAAETNRIEAINVLEEGDTERQCYHSQWILIPGAPGAPTSAALAKLGRPLEPRPGLPAWTDDRWSLYPVLQWGLR